MVTRFCNQICKSRDENIHFVKSLLRSVIRVPLVMYKFTTYIHADIVLCSCISVYMYLYVYRHIIYAIGCNLSPCVPY